MIPLSTYSRSSIYNQVYLAAKILGRGFISEVKVKQCSDIRIHNKGFNTVFDHCITEICFNFSR